MKRMHRNRNLIIADYLASEWLLSSEAADRLQHEEQKLQMNESLNV